jgi:hypothetical protein
MQLDLVQESWQELKRYINTMDRSDAAEGLVSVLIENGIDAEDIRDTFTSDSDIKAALSGYVDDDDQEDEDNDYQELDFGDD